MTEEEDRDMKVGYLFAAVKARFEDHICFMQPVVGCEECEECKITKICVGMADLSKLRR